MPFEKKLVTRTFEGIALQPLYTRADLPAATEWETTPGQAPYVRGFSGYSYKYNLWEFAQEIAVKTPAEFNATVVADLMRGQDSVVVTPDAAARAGLAQGGGGDSDGVAIATLADLTTALAGVDLQAVPVHLRAGADALPLAAFYLELARTRRVAWEKLTGSITADPLAEWAETGRLVTRLDGLHDSLAGWTAWAANHAPQLRTVGVNAAIWGNAGATAVQELAFALASAAEYLRALIERGVSPEVAASRVQFRFAIGPQFFTEIAKFRALRPLWTRVLMAFGAPAESATRVSVQAATGRWNKTRLDPHVNMLRVTTEALSAVLGGCDALHIAPFDDVAGATSEHSRRTARNVHTLLAEEFSFSQVADAAGGSFYVEKLTDELARKAWELFQAFEGRGGFAAALREGYPQQLVAKSALEKGDAVAKRRLGLIGTNLFPNLKEKPLAAQAGTPPAPATRKTKLDVIAPVLPPDAPWPAHFEAALAAAKSGATIAELARLTRPASSSEWVVTPVAPWRASARFELLRTAADDFAKRTGARPRVFLAKMGPSLQHKARADFSAGFFAVGGFEVLAKQSFEQADAAAKAAAASGAAIAVLCSTDDTYPTLVPAFAAALKAAKPGTKVVLAGLPADPAVVTAFRSAGVDEFIHLRANVPDILAKFLQQIGALA